MVKTEVPAALRGRTYVYLICAVAAVGGFLFGYDQAIIVGAIIFLKKQFSLSPVELGFAFASAQIGCVAGPLISGWLSDWLGRKKVLIIAAFLFGVSAVGTAMARNMFEFNAFRILTGFAIGLASLVSPMYIAEVSPAGIRGGLVTVNQLAIVTGGTSSIGIAYFLSLSGNWRWMFGLAIFPAIAFGIGLWFVPQSPRWLAQKNRDQEATEVLTRIDNRENAEKEMAAIRESLKAESGGWRELAQPGIRYAMLIALGLGFFQAANGAGTITWYGAIIFQRAGFVKISDAILQTLIVAVWSLVLTVLTMLLVDRVGRKPLLLIGSAGIAFGQIVLAAAFHYDLRGPYVLIGFFLVLGFYAISLAPITWLVMSEIFPTRIRAKAQSAATVFVWLSTLAAAQLFAPYMAYLEKTYGSPAGAFLTFAALSGCAFLFCWRIVPETKGKTLEQIATMWLPKKAARVVEL